MQTPNGGVRLAGSVGRRAGGSRADGTRRSRILQLFSGRIALSLAVGGMVPRERSDGSAGYKSDLRPRKEAGERRANPHPVSADVLRGVWGGRGQLSAAWLERSERECSIAMAISTHTSPCIYGLCERGDGWAEEMTSPRGHGRGARVHGSSRVTRFWRKGGVCARDRSPVLRTARIQMSSTGAQVIPTPPARRATECPADDGGPPLSSLPPSSPKTAPRTDAGDRANDRPASSPARSERSVRQTPDTAALSTGASSNA